MTNCYFCECASEGRYGNYECQLTGDSVQAWVEEGATPDGCIGDPVPFDCAPANCPLS